MTLMEKRAVLAKNLSTTPAPEQARVDDIPSDIDLQTKRKAEEPAEVSEPVVRTDDAKNNGEIDPDTRARLAAAALDLLKPRTDDSSEVTRGPISGTHEGHQPPSPKEPGSSPLNRRPDGDQPDEGKPRKADDDDDNTPAWAKALVDAVGALGKRMDAMEKGNTADDDEDDEDKAIGERGQPKGLAADDARSSYRRNARLINKGQLGRITSDGMTVDQFLKYQARANRVYDAWGKNAPKAMHGEELNDYRRRLLYPYQHHSEPFKKADLKVLAADQASFDHAESEIWKAALDAVRDPSTVPAGILRESTENRHGHTHTKFYGSPKTWMAPFMVPGKLVKRIIERTDSIGGPGRVHYERA